MLDLRKIGALLRDEEQPFPLDDVHRLLDRHGIELTVLGRGTAPPPDLDLVMAMGGDGTVLRALALCPDTPVLAINYGTVGFLTAGDRTDLERQVHHRSLSHNQIDPLPDGDLKARLFRLDCVRPDRKRQNPVIAGRVRLQDPSGAGLRTRHRYGCVGDRRAGGV